MNKTSEPATALLISWLAGADALFLPERDSRAPWRSSLYEKRSLYHARGLDYMTHGADANERKQKEAASRELLAAGLINTFRSPSGRTVSVKLTDLGDDAARSLVGFVLAKYEVLAKLASLSTHPEVTITGWCPEVLLNGGSGWGDGLSDGLGIVEDMVLPTLSRAWAESNSDALRHVYYRVTPAGNKALSKGILHYADDLPAELPDGYSRYRQYLAEAIEGLHADQERRQDIGEIPVSCSPISNGHTGK